MGSIDYEKPAERLDNGVLNGLHHGSSAPPRPIDEMPELFSENITAKILRSATDLLLNNVRQPFQ